MSEIEYYRVNLLIREGFPLEYLEKNYGITFDSKEKEYINLAYHIHLIERREQYNRAEMPRPCIGTPLELWGLLQVFSFGDYWEALKIIKREFYHIDQSLEGNIRGTLTCGKRELLPILGGIFKKICRTRDFDFDNSLLNFNNDEGEKQMRLAQYMAHRTRGYGQFPHEDSQHKYFELNDYEKDSVSLLYIKILWESLMTHHDHIIPSPEGTAMEIYFLNSMNSKDVWLLSSMLSPKDNKILKNKTSYALKQIYDWRCSEEFLPLIMTTPNLDWINDSYYYKISRKLGVQNYFKFLYECEKKQKEDTNMIDRFRYKKEVGIPKEICRHIKSIYKKLPIQRFTVPTWQPFQYWRDAVTGLWFLSRLPTISF